MTPIFVCDLIKDNAILTQHSKRAVSVDVSFLLPSYNGYADGYVTRMIQSVQQMRDFSWEMIIVDDGSSDGSISYFQSLVENDPRFILIQHKCNIGLPAISEYEAYIQSRGEHIAFAFDDVEFVSERFSEMVLQAKKNNIHFIHGVCELAYTDRKNNPAVWLIGAGSNSENLLHANMIGNSSVLVHRDVLETVGLYDPHVSLSRICDWDLWIRISKKYFLTFFPHVVIKEGGARRKNSIGNTYPLDGVLSSTRMSMERDQDLLPQNFPQVNTVNDDLIKDSCKSQILEACNAHLRNNRLQLGPLKGLLLGDFTMSAYLMINHLSHPSFKIDYYAGGAEDAASILSVSCRYDFVVICRSLQQHSRLRFIQKWKEMSLPVFYLCDDNLPLLSKNHPEFNWYGSKDFAQSMRHINAVVCPNLALKNYFKSSFPDLPAYFVPISGKVTNNSRKIHQTERSLRIGIFGGVHRGNPKLIKNLLDLYPDAHIYLSAKDTTAYAANSRIHPIPPLTSPHQFLAKWKSLELDVIIHPPSKSGNSIYKNPNVMLISHLLEAIPIVFKEDYLNEIDWPFKATTVREAAMMVAEVSKKEVRDRLIKQLHDLCVQHFNPNNSSKMFAEFLHEMRVPRSTTMAKYLTLLDTALRSKSSMIPGFSHRMFILLRSIYYSKPVYFWLKPMSENLSIVRAMKIKVWNLFRY
ncbi:MAG: glycosyltransferase family 2 protein [Bdellovibrionaceae bacterium]|nr:glycosyltransferase family 2 protein [Pseudobdellovibrionaceae bacterium]